MSLNRSYLFVLFMALILFVSCDRDTSLSVPKKISWQDQWMNNIGDMFPKISQVIPSLIAEERIFADEYLKGGWVVVEQSNWQLSQECRLIIGDEYPKQSTDVAYIAVIGAPIKQSVGFWGFQGGSRSEEMFVSEYTIYLIDWKKKHLVAKEIIQSPPGTLGFFKSSWEENQRKVRPSIAEWLAYRGVIESQISSRSYPETPIQMASRKGNAGLVNYLLTKEGYNISEGHHGTPIHDALEQAHINVAYLLLQKGVKKDLLIFSGLGDLDSVKAIIESDPKLINLKSETGNTPLHYAAANGQIEVTRFLLSKGADVNAEAYWDHAWQEATPLHKASRYGHAEVVELLLKNGATINAKATQRHLGHKSDSTPLDVALGNSHRRVVEILRKYGG